jgi:predicted ArsR family transcriptional regulator
MLEAILRLAAEQDTADVALIADALDLSPALVSSALEELTRQGYLRVVVTGCAGPCAGCPSRATCLFGSPPRIWSLTPKGERLLAERSSREEGMTATGRPTASS